jgi:hypothetical protein
MYGAIGRLSIKFLFLTFTIWGLAACNGEKPTYTELLTSRTWGKPEILHQPPSADHTINDCTEYHNFKVDGTYLFYDDCYPEVYYVGKWNWEKMGQEIRLESSSKNLPPKVLSILVYELTERALHTKEREAQEPSHTENYWEKVYRPVYKKP